MSNRKTNDRDTKAVALRFIDDEELKKKGICFSRMHLYRLMAAGEFPSTVSVGRAKIAWVESEIDEWMNSRVSARSNKATIERKEELVLSAPDNVMERRMDWEPWFNGPRMPVDSMIFALRSDYSGVDLLYCHGERKGQKYDEWLCFANGERVPDETIYCAYIIAPPATPRYQAPNKLKAVK